MSELDPNLPREPEQQAQEAPKQEEGYTPASFEKRTAAWMGIVYMLMFLFIITFSLYANGRSLVGTFPLFLVPVAAAALVITLRRQRKGVAPGGLAVTIPVCLVCLAAAGVGLWLGVPALAAALAG